jgi:serine O-acetyltransferase
MFIMVFERIKEDIRSVFDNDPAAKNTLEVLLTYPGLHALWMHRIANVFYRRGWFTLARFTSHFSRFITGIEIHPGATIGRRVFIDHGMGIVIGETSEIGDDCLLYKGVVLGGTTIQKKKRHPTLGRGVVVGSNACILGAIEIGDYARVGSGSVVVKPVPPGATVVGIPGKIVKQTTSKKGASPEDALVDKLQHADLPDPLIEVLATWRKLFEKYEKRIRALEREHGIEAQDLSEEFMKELFLLSDVSLEQDREQEPDKDPDD